MFPFLPRLIVHNHDMCPNEWTMYTLKIKLAKFVRGGGQQFKPPPLAKRSRVLMVIFSVKRNHEHLRWCQFLCRLDLFIMGKYVHVWLLLLLTGLLLQSKPVTLWETKSDLNWSFKLAYQCLGAKETNVTRNWDESVQVFF